jgi:hypothetical protein
MSAIAIRWAAQLRVHSLAVFALLVALGAGPAIAAKWYVDAKLGDLKPEEIVTVANPQPAQLLLEFQTDGVANAKGTKYVKPLAITAINARHAFSELTETPAPSGTVLTIAMNNLTEKGAAGKGFKTGLTFGLAPLLVTDRYAVHFELLRGPGSTPISCDVAHALHLTMGKQEDPTIGVLVKNPQVGMQMIIDQVMAHGINCLAGKMAAAPPAGQ